MLRKGVNHHNTVDNLEERNSKLPTWEENEYVQVKQVYITKILIFENDISQEQFHC